MYFIYFISHLQHDDRHFVLISIPVQPLKACFLPYVYIYEFDV